MKISEKIYLLPVGTIFAVLTLYLMFGPRTTYSELEKRNVAQFPRWSDHNATAAEYPAAISQWFSDSEPSRDRFMTLSMLIRQALRLTPPWASEEEMVVFRPSTQTPADDPATIAGSTTDNDTISHFDRPDGTAKISNAGTLIVGTGANVRALMAYGGSANATNKFADAAGRYAAEFPEVKVYALVAPLATEFYLPEKAAKASSPQRPPIDNLRNKLANGAIFVDAYAALSHHVDEPIYLRTDHHWAPLGAYYAAQEFARVAGVPVPVLTDYEAHTVANFVGTMYGYTQDISVKNAPEDFVYYTPKGVNTQASYITYYTNKDYQITSETKPYKRAYFQRYKDGSPNAYMTFMGGDQHLVKVETEQPGTRRVLVIKDSYGNAVPGYLFKSFNQVHVADFRYFRKNLREYISTNGITDILLCFNIFNASGSYAPARLIKFLDGTVPPLAAPSKPDKPALPAATESTAPSLPADSTAVANKSEEPEKNF